MLLGFSIVSVYPAGKNVSLLTKDRILITLLTLWAPQCHWLWCGQTHLSSPALHVASGRTGHHHHHSDHLSYCWTGPTGCKIKERSEPKTPDINKSYSFASSRPSLTLYPFWCMKPRVIHITSVLITTSHPCSKLCISPASLPVLRCKGFRLLVTPHIAHLSPSCLSDLLAPRVAQQATNRGQYWYHPIKLVPVPSDKAFIATLLWHVSTETWLVRSNQDLSQVQHSCHLFFPPR